jgi:hypothetical protein
MEDVSHQESLEFCTARVSSLVTFLFFLFFIFLCSMVYQIASIEIQITWRNYKHKRGVNINTEVSKAPVYKTRDSFRRAAVKIQNLWRRFCYKRVYRYFRDLILHKLKGAPHELLRSIIPSECGLLDKAAGVHVRFRLGGAVFPPAIYFKIYTHRPLCDVNAFAPRNYVKEKRPESIAVHNKFDDVNMISVRRGTIRVGGTYFGTEISTTNITGDGWYRRDENNPWRTISTVLVTETLTGAGETIPFGLPQPEDKRLKPFHYSRLVRTVDVIRERKKRRRQWMLKAYMFSAARKYVADSHPNSDEESVDNGNGADQVARLKDDSRRRNDASSGDSGRDGGSDYDKGRINLQSSQNKAPEVMYDDELLNWR